MQNREIIPHQQVADLPFMAHGEAGLRLQPDLRLRLIASARSPVLPL